MSDVKFTISAEDLTGASLKKLQENLKATSQQAKEAHRAITSISSSLEKVKLPDKFFYENEAIAKKLKAKQARLNYTFDKIEDYKTKQRLSDLDYAKIEAQEKKYKADLAKLNVDTLKFKKQLNEQEQNLLKRTQGKLFPLLSKEQLSPQYISAGSGFIGSGNIILDRQAKKAREDAQRSQLLSDKLKIKEENLRQRQSERIIREFEKARATPINYVVKTDILGRKTNDVIGVTKAGKSIYARDFQYDDIGGKYISQNEIAQVRKQQKDSGDGFLGGRRTFRQVLGGYIAYRTAVATEQLAADVLSTPARMENIRNSLAANLYAKGVTDRKELKSKTEEEVSFLYELGRKYGFKSSVIAPEYTQMLSTTILNKKFSIKNIRDITEAYSSLSTIMSLTPERRKLVFLSLGQMIGKGKIRGEEVNQQLVEHMGVGKVVIAKALEKTINDKEIYKQYQTGKINFDELMKKGVIDASVLINTLGEVQKMFGNMGEEKSRGFTGSMGRLQNSIERFSDLVLNGALPATNNFINATAGAIDYINKSIDPNNKNKTTGQKLTNEAFDLAIPALSGAMAARLLLAAGSRTALIPTPLTAGIGTGMVLAGAGIGAATAWYGKNKEEDNVISQAPINLNTQKAINQIVNPLGSVNFTPSSSANFSQKPQQIELILKVEGNQNFTPNVFKSDGSRLSYGKNILAGN